MIVQKVMINNIYPSTKYIAFILRLLNRFRFSLFVLHDFSENLEDNDEKKFQIRNEDVRDTGESPGCPGCIAALWGLTLMRAGTDLRTC